MVHFFKHFIQSLSTILSPKVSTLPQLQVETTPRKSPNETGLLSSGINLRSGYLTRWGAAWDEEGCHFAERLSWKESSLAASSW